MSVLLGYRTLNVQNTLPTESHEIILKLGVGVWVGVSYGHGCIPFWKLMASHVKQMNHRLAEQAFAKLNFLSKTP